MAASGSPDFESIERRLQADLAEARRRLEEAKVILKEKSNLAYELGLAHPDGVHAIHSASRVYADAVAQYRRALQRFGEFTIHRRVPED